MTSDLPEKMMKHEHLQSLPIDPDIIENMKMKGPIGYALNRKKTIRNKVTNYLLRRWNGMMKNFIYRFRTT